jgi:hypothetical protein
LMLAHTSNRNNFNTVYTAKWWFVMTTLMPSGRCFLNEVSLLK